jgi:hypothetical protein
MTAESKPAIPIWGVRHVAIRVKDVEAARRGTKTLSMTVEDEFRPSAVVRFGLTTTTTWRSSRRTRTLRRRTRTRLGWRISRC